MASLCFAVLHKKQGDDSSLTRWADKKHIVAKECDERNLLHPSKLWQRFSFFMRQEFAFPPARIKTKLFMKRHIILCRRDTARILPRHSAKLLGSQPSFIHDYDYDKPPMFISLTRKGALNLATALFIFGSCIKYPFYLANSFLSSSTNEQAVASNPRQAVSHQKQISPSRFLINFSISFTPLKCSARVALSIVMKRS